MQRNLLLGAEAIGQAAIDAIAHSSKEQAKEQFDLIFMDWQMPKMDGIVTIVLKSTITVLRN